MTSISYCDIRGEWEQRRISIFGVAKSFISQLSVGQDLTKVSLPSIFLRPYSILEEFACRTMGHIDLLLDIAEHQDPAVRMMKIIGWYSSMFKNETFHHKPYNPVLGETHKCIATVKDKEGVEHTIYGVLEQVSHHPPITASRFDIPSKGIAIEVNIENMVKFYRNSVGVDSSGCMIVTIGDELYFISKGTPDMHIQNTILGRKYVYWHNSVQFECPSTGLGGEITFAWKDGYNQFEGRVFKKLKKALSFKSQTNLHLKHDLDASLPKSKSSSNLRDLNKLEDDETVLYLEGKNGATLFSSETKPGKKTPKNQHMDIEETAMIIPKYPKPDKLEVNASLRIWQDLSKAIVDNDMGKADEIKKRIEDVQRTKRKEREENNEEHVQVNFSLDKANEFWHINNMKWYENCEELREALAETETVN